MQKIFSFSLLLVFLQNCIIYMIGGGQSSLASFPLPLLFFLFVAVYSLFVKGKYPKEMIAPLFICFLFVSYSILFQRELYYIGFISAWLMPIFLIISMKNISISSKNINFVAKFLFCFVVANFFVAYIEHAFHVHLMTNIDNQNAVLMGKLSEKYEFRSNGLMGHPLSCGQLTSAFLSFVLISSCQLKHKFYFCLFAFLAMMCFNTRFALVTCGLSFFIFLLYNIKRSPYKGRYIVISIILLVFSGLVLFKTGLGGRIVHIGLYGNDASSLARVEIFKVFDYMDLNSLLFGSKNDFLVYAMKCGKIDNLIVENPFLVYVLSFGLIMAALLFVIYFRMILGQMRSWSLYEKIIVLLPWSCNIFSNISLAGGATSISSLLVFVYLYNRRHTLFFNNPSNFLVNEDK